MNKRYEIEKDILKIKKSKSYLISKTSMWMSGVILAIMIIANIVNETEIGNTEIFISLVIIFSYLVRTQYRFRLNSLESELNQLPPE